PSSSSKWKTGWRCAWPRCTSSPINGINPETAGKSIFQIGRFFFDFSFHAILEVDDPVADRAIRTAYDLGGENTRIPGTIEGHSGDRNPSRHLENGEYRIPTIDRIAAFDGHADHGQRREAGNHPGQMRGATGSGNDHADPAHMRLTGKLHHFLRCPVRGHDIHFIRDAERLQDFGGLLHDRQIGIRSHDDADKWLAHAMTLMCSLRKLAVRI